MKLVLVGVVLTWLLVGVVCWLVYQLMRQNGRLLVRIEALEQRLGQVGMAPEPDRPRGLPVGSNAPAFELPDLDGGRVALEQFRGRRVLLIFFDPGCGFCRQMAPHLAALPADGGDGRPVPLVVTAGDAGESRKLVEQHGLRCAVLIQREMEVARLYQATGEQAFGDAARYWFRRALAYRRAGTGVGGFAAGWPGAGGERRDSADSGFLEGVAHNPEGFILNTLRKRTRAYLILHRSSCRTVGGEPARGSRWTVDCIKFCGDQLPLRSRLRAHIALMPQRQCGLGIVSRQQPRLQVRRWLDMRLDP